MEHYIFIVFVFQMSLIEVLPVSQRNHGDTFLGEDDVVMVDSIQHSRNLALPEVEALMPENEGLVLLLGDIHNNHIISVDEDGFIRDCDFLDTLLLVPQHEDVGVPDV